MWGNVIKTVQFVKAKWVFLWCILDFGPILASPSYKTELFLI